MITTADWLRYIESLGPTDEREVLRERIESAGADPGFAAWLLSIVRQRQIARAVARSGSVIAAAGIAWSAYLWWLALRGAPDAPNVTATIPAAVMIGLGALMMIIATSIELSPPLHLDYRTLPSELAPPPRQVGASRRTAGAWRLAIAVFCFILAPASLSVEPVRNRIWLRDHGVETTGRVAGFFTRSGSKGRIDHYYRYEFDEGTGARLVRSRDNLRVGDTVPVTYLPERPAINVAQRKADLRPLLSLDDPILAIVLVYLIAVIPLTMLAAAYGVGLQRSLAERGVATVATVTQVRRQMIEYRYDDQTRRYVYGKRRIRERLTEGQPLVILYDPEKPKRSIPLGALSDLELR